MSVDRGVDSDTQVDTHSDTHNDASPARALAPASRLAERVDELHTQARAGHGAANEAHALLVVYTAPTRSAAERERYLRTMHEAMRAAMPVAEVVARLGQRAVAAIVSREPRALRDAVRSLNAQIDVAIQEDRLPTTHVCIEPIPVSGGKLAALQRDL